MPAKSKRTPPDTAAVYKALLGLFAPYLKRLAPSKYPGIECYINTRRIMPNKKPLCFGGAQRRPGYVSFYFMPVYMFPDLMKGASPDLKRRQQGKSCFNFSAVEKALFAELAGLVKAGFERFKQEGLLE